MENTMNTMQNTQSETKETTMTQMIEVPASELKSLKNQIKVMFGGLVIVSSLFFWNIYSPSEVKPDRKIVMLEEKVQLMEKQLDIVHADTNSLVTLIEGQSERNAENNRMINGMIGILNKHSTRLDEHDAADVKLWEGLIKLARKVTQ